MRHRSLALAVSLGVAALVCLIASCGGGGNAPANEPVKPKAPPLFWDDQEDLNWIYRNQFKTTMRALWVDCAKLVTMGRGSEQPNWPLLEAYSKDISRRADRVAIRWEAFAEPGKSILEAVDDKDWLLVYAENERFGKSCDDCHLETWSPIYQHATKNVIADWLRNELPPMKHTMLHEESAPPAVENRIVMQKLLEHHDNTDKAITAKDGAKVKEHVNYIMGVASERAALWRNLKNAADAMAEAAANKDRASLGPRYKAITANCIGCHQAHAQFVDPKTPPRNVLNPMPWE